MSNRRLTDKQEAYSKLVASGSAGNHTAAYRQIYNVKPDASEKSVWACAYDLNTNPLVAARIDELKAASETALTKETSWTLSKLTDAATQNMDGAREAGQWSSANGALEFIGRSTGLLKDNAPIAGQIQVTRIIINLAPGVEAPDSVIEAESYRDVSDEGGPGGHSDG